MVLNNRKQDTIVACATPIGRGGIGIVRISGPKVKSIASAILGKLPKPRYATYSTFIDGNNEIIDIGLAIYFPAPSSFTGEDILELHGHGGIIIQDCLLKRALQLGARLAWPGEFSKRAFLNGKIDLAQAEALADLIDAASHQAARSAIRSLQGEFSRLIDELKVSLINLRVQIEASIDFPEEELDLKTRQKQALILDETLSIFAQIKKSAQQGMLLRDGINVVIVGKPNVGKSSLLNRFTGKETAIITDIPGTTRDVLCTKILIDGLPLHVSDTAGLHLSPNRIELEGIRKARKEIKEADHILCLVDAYTNDYRQPEEIITELQLPREKKNITIIFNKIDLTGDCAKLATIDGFSCIYLSVKTGLGLDLLKEHLKTSVGFNAVVEGEVVFSARRRHLDALEQIEKQVFIAKQHLIGDHSAELIAEDLQQAQNILNTITGDFSSNDLLDLIFAEFCVGK